MGRWSLSLATGATGARRPAELPLILPTEEFFPDRYEGKPEDANVNVARVAGYMGAEVEDDHPGTGPRAYGNWKIHRHPSEQTDIGELGKEVHLFRARDGWCCLSILPWGAKTADLTL